tara:strand:+ start:2748 stop:3350 length:603 start_codon:yes stop_codon:yes gene_type:complete
MPTFRLISDEEVSVDSALTQQLMQAFKDNLTAVIEADASAPKIKRNAISDAVADQKPVTAGDVALGTNGILNALRVVGGSASANFDSHGLIICVTGKYKVIMRATNGTGSGTLRSELIKSSGGSETVLLTGTTTSGSAAQTDVTNELQLTAGDLLILRGNIQTNLATTGTAEVIADLGISVESAGFYNKLAGTLIDNSVT